MLFNTALGRKLNLFIIISFFLFNHCTGTYYGVPGSAVYSRSEAVARLNKALVLKTAACGANDKNTSAVYAVISQSASKTLDGAYYTKKDIDACEKYIYVSGCSTYFIPCKVSSKEFLESGPYFQGGF